MCKAQIRSMHAACDKQHDQAQGKPGKRKQRADLSHYIARLIRIIPDMPFEPYIHYDADKKFKYRKDAGSRRGFHQRGSPVILFKIVIKCQQTCSPGQRHRPVSISSEHIFNYRIACGSRKKHYNTHIYSICRLQGCSHVIFMKIAAFRMPGYSSDPSVSLVSWFSSAPSAVPDTASAAASAWSSPSTCS